MFDPLTLNCNSIVNKFTVYMNSGQEPIIGSCSGSFFDEPGEQVNRCIFRMKSLKMEINR